EIVMTNTITGTTTMDLSTLAKGVYSVRVSNGDKTTVRSVVLN
ncbi:MAG: T9SS type A sorting domain-containing protein, partial [Flavobacteriales bacterium]|nr:T9SS type A sorting domain-containing protein [Flavobacteriales bacterium]